MPTQILRYCARNVTDIFALWIWQSNKFIATNIIFTISKIEKQRIRRGENRKHVELRAAEEGSEQDTSSGESHESNNEDEERANSTDIDFGTNMNVAVMDMT